MTSLSSAEALSILVLECEEEIKKWKDQTAENRRHGCISILRSFSPGPYAFFLTGSFISVIFMAIGAVDMDNEISFNLLFISGFLFLFTIASWLFLLKTRRSRQNFRLNKTIELIHYLRRTSPTFSYSILPEPLTEDMWGQLCFREGIAVNVPKILIVRGDHLLLRPGQIIPCECVTTEGQRLRRGDRLDLKVGIDAATGASEQLQPISAISCESLIISHIEDFLSAPWKSSFLRQQIDFVLYSLLRRYFLLPFSLLVVFSVFIRYFQATSESFYGTRFIFSIPSLILLPLFSPLIPYIFYFLRKWNQNSIASSLGIPYESSPKDLVDIFGRLTGVSIIDKKGLLSPANPSIDKVIVFRESEDGQLAPETLGLSSELENNRWKLYFDDPSWEESLPNLRPLGLNLQLNSCRHNHSFVSFLDHLSVVSTHVPRTIVAAQRRCMCHFPRLLGFDQESCSQFLEKSPQLLGFYKRQPGDAPLPGLTKHRTPLEMAFCCIHSDAKSMHSHVSCQGTADLVLDACSHVWNGKELVPLSSRLTRMVRDIYQRNSMTGYCLLISYRATGSSLGEEMQNKYIEVPLAREGEGEGKLGIRCQSADNLAEDFFEKDVLKTADDVIENLFTGHVLCGLVAMQYEALPYAVQLVEGLENNCVRFVYFSRENELRSRVFAEKLGLEAGWNCHISLAEQMEEKEGTRTMRDIFTNAYGWNNLSMKTPVKKKSWLSRSEAFLNGRGDDRMRNSPLRRQSSAISLKVGAMPNKARLPTGVSCVRPHLEEVDNVPLLVGLFTDCDPAVNKEMLSIMQENDEVVLSIGSSLNISNTSIFLSSDLSVCVPPVVDKNCSLADRNEEGFSANDLAARIMAVATDFELNHQQLLNLPDTVSACRHRLWSVKSSLYFLFLSSVQLSFLLFLSAISFLPLVFTTSQVFLAIFIQIPLLFIGTVWTPFHPRKVVVRISPKSPRQNSSSIFIISFVLQFLPSLLVLLTTFFFSLADNATMLCSFSDVACSFGDDLKLSTQEIRNVIGLHFSVYLCVNSAAWIHPLSSSWTDNPLRSFPWLTSVFLTISSQVIYSYSCGVLLHRVLSLPSLLVMFFWSCLLFIINEICKLRSIRSFSREQRRTKLAFDTKLGMNSPY